MLETDRSGDEQVRSWRVGLSISHHPNPHWDIPDSQLIARRNAQIAENAALVIFTTLASECCASTLEAVDHIPSSPVPTHAPRLDVMFIM